MTNEAKKHDGAAVRFPPPLVPLISLGLGILLHWLVAPLTVSISAPLRWAIAALMLGLGLGLMAGAIGLFRRTGQHPAPWESTPQIVTTGVYAFTRNPMYLAMGLLQAAIGFALANGWVIALAPATWTAIYFIAIRHEEAYLAGKFGADYQDYKQRIRRWL